MSLGELVCAVVISLVVFGIVTMVAVGLEGDRQFGWQLEEEPGEGL